MTFLAKKIYKKKVTTVYFCFKVCVFEIAHFRKIASHVYVLVLLNLNVLESVSEYVMMTTACNILEEKNALLCYMYTILIYKRERMTFL